MFRTINIVCWWINGGLFKQMIISVSSSGSDASHWTTQFSVKLCGSGSFSLHISFCPLSLQANISISSRTKVDLVWVSGSTFVAKVFEE